MIQRIQSVYLLLIFIISLLLFFIPIWDYDKFIPFEIANALVGIISLITIFVFSNRKRQLKICSLLIFLLAVLLFCIFLEPLIFDSKFHVNYKLGAYLPFVSVLFCILAKRAIKKDDELVRATDRLR